MTDTAQSIRDGAIAGSQYKLVVPNDATGISAEGVLGNDSGSSVDFKGYRQYELGDDLRRLDWNVYARSDRMVVKLFQNEISPHLDIVLDTSRSMACMDERRAHFAAKLAALLCTAARNAGCSHNVRVIRDGQCAPLRGGVAESVQWEPPVFDAAVSLCDALRNAPVQFRKNGMRIVISDLLWREPPELFLRLCGDGAARLTVIRLFSRADETPPADGFLRLRDSETGEIRELFVDATLRRAYSARYNAHTETWFRECRRAGAQFVSLPVDAPDSDNGRIPQLEAMEILGAI